MSGGRRPGLHLATAVLRLYPSDWRARYGEEVAALIDVRPAGGRDVVDLARGALDAWLHPAEPARWPSVLAIVGGGLWTVLALARIVDPVPADWPGYRLEMLPSALVGVTCLGLASVGAWLRMGDGASRTERLAVGLALVGHAGWLGALVAAAAGVAYGPGTAVLGTLAAAGTAWVGVSLLRRGDVRIGGLLGLASVGMVTSTSYGWLAFAIGWSAAGLAMLPIGDRRGPLARR